MVQSPVLRMTGICKQFPGVVALHNVNLSIGPGEIHGLVGENGAGKSTLMKILSGAYQADSGTIEVFGKPVLRHSPLHMLELGIAVIYQETMLAPHLSVAENLFLGRLPRTGLGTVNWQKTAKRSFEIMTRLGFSVDPSARVMNLSVAQRQMVEIAGALSRDARIVVLDEPSAVLGSAELENLFNVVRRLASDGVSFVYISHRLQEVFSICDSVTVLRDGVVVGSSRLADVDPPSLIRMMIGRQLADIYPHRSRRYGETILKVEGLSRAGVLHGLDLEVRKGQILGICGLAGSGRTEFLRALIGADRSSCHRYTLRGRVLRHVNPRFAILNGISLLPEDRKAQGCFLPQSLAFNVTISRLSPLMRAGMLSERRERRTVAELVRRLSIRAPGHHAPVRDLSGGNQQKSLIARSLNAECELLLIDEPTRGVDVGAKREIYQLLARLADEARAAIVIVSSELSEILGLCDRIVVMRDGRIAGTFDHAEATEEMLMRCAVGSASGSAQAA